MINDTGDIKVSVCVVTYNQEKYIAECLDSLVNQETDFKFEIIVGEDCSTDGTRAIVQQYVDKYPNLIKPIFHKQNVGAVENVKQVYIAAKGKYIAHIDGDDMALPTKLQKQFDVLEGNSDCSICVHNMKAIDGDSKPTVEAFKIFKEKKYNLLDLYLINPFFIHSSKMFINKIEKYIENLDDNALDIEVHIEQAKQGNILFLDEKLGYYRQFLGVTYYEGLINPLIPERIRSVYNNVDKGRFRLKEVVLIELKYRYILLKYTSYYLRKKKLKLAVKSFSECIIRI